MHESIYCNMRRQVAHAIQRLAEGQGERFSRCNTYEQGTREAGKRRDCYRINIAKSDTRRRTSDRAASPLPK